MRIRYRTDRKCTDSKYIKDDYNKDMKRKLCSEEKLPDSVRGQNVVSLFKMKGEKIYFVPIQDISVSNLVQGTSV